VVALQVELVEYKVVQQPAAELKLLLVLVEAHQLTSI
jgi:hypothetical protein